MFMLSRCGWFGLWVWMIECIDCHFEVAAQLLSMCGEVQNNVMMTGPLQYCLVMYNSFIGYKHRCL